VTPDLQKCSPVWTRTKNLPVNSRLLCQLSYGGLPGPTSRVPGLSWRPKPQYSAEQPPRREGGHGVPGPAACGPGAGPGDGPEQGEHLHSDAP
jgi:hypothetical protein